MSTGPESSATTVQPWDQADRPRPSYWDQVRPALVDVGIALAWFAVVAVIGGLLWWQLTPLADFTRTTTGAAMDEEQLSMQVNADGWFFVIAAVGGLLSGIGLLSWRRRDPILMVITVAACGLVATWIMLRTGLIAGPPDPDKVAPHVAVGTKIPLQLRIHAEGLWVVWSVTALLGAVGVVWGTDSDRHEPPEETLSSRI